MVSGRSPSGQAGRPSDQAPAGLGDTATIPNAGFALIRSDGAPGRYVIVRVTKAGKRFSRVETTDGARTWQPLTRELWQFATIEEAQAKLDEFRAIERDFIANRNRKFAGVRA